MTDFRELCAELVEAVLSDDSHIDCMDIARRARAALAEPQPTDSGATKEIRLTCGDEIIRITPEGFFYNGQHTEDCGEAHYLLVEFLKRTMPDVAWRHPADGPAVQNREPASVITEPSDEELRRLYCELFMLRCDPSSLGTGPVRFGRAVLARWGTPNLAETRSSLEPIPVSERLPEAGDCDAEGRCWWGEPQIDNSHDATWNLCTRDDADEFLTWGTKCGWLPYSSLPLPREVE